MAKMIINGEVYSGSTNYASAITYIKEDGTKSTVQKELDSRPVNNNLLINSNFANPVNQRGITNHTESTVKGNGTYTIDRWRAYSQTNATVTMEVVDGGVKITPNDDNGFFKQFVENLPNGKYSASVKANGEIYSCTFNYTGVYLSHDFGNGLTLRLSASGTVTSAPNAVDFMIGILNGYSFTIEWVKLELGDHATPYVPRLYWEEFELCQRYYQIIDVGNAVCVSSNANNISFYLVTPLKMRENGTLINADVRVRKNTLNENGFTVQLSSYNSKTGYIFIMATKSSHGLTYANYPSLAGSVYMDAEL